MKLADAHVPDPRPVLDRRLTPDDFEAGRLHLVVFGTGIGEAMVVILPDDTLGVVDGCCTNQDNDPVLHFVHQWQEKHPKPIRFVCLTHPHADHYAGLGRLAEKYLKVGVLQAVGSPLAVSAPFIKSYLKILESRKPVGDRIPDDPLRGLEYFLIQLEEAGKLTGDGSHLLIRERTLLRARMSGRMVEIKACAPSDYDIHRAQQDVIENAAGLPELELNPNQVSAAIAVTWGDAGILLGGDLLVPAKPFHGWAAAMTSLPEKIQVIKAAHHASDNAHHEDVWTSRRPALAIVTPSHHARTDSGGKAYPPRQEMIAELAKHSVVAIAPLPAWAREGQHENLAGLGLLSPRFAPIPASTVRRSPKSLTDESPRAFRSAVAVSLDADGNITRFQLTGEGNVFLGPADQTVTKAAP